MYLRLGTCNLGAEMVGGGDGGGKDATEQVFARRCYSEKLYNFYVAAGLHGGGPYFREILGGLWNAKSAYIC